MKWTSPLGFALLCAHCTLAGLIAAGGALGFAGLTLFGVPLAWVAPPILILGGFALYLWSGARASRKEAEACAVPHE